MNFPWGLIFAYIKESDKFLSVSVYFTSNILIHTSYKIRVLRKMTGSPSQLMERLRTLIRQDTEVRMAPLNSTPVHSVNNGDSSSLFATPESGANRLEGGSVGEASVTGLSTSSSFREAVKQDHRLKMTLVLTLCVFVSLSSIIFALTLKINHLQTELADNQKFCKTEARLEVKGSVVSVVSTSLGQNYTEPLVQTSSTPPTSLPGFRFSGNKDVIWDSWDSNITPFSPRGANSTYINN